MLALGLCLLGFIDPKSLHLLLSFFFFFFLNAMILGRDVKITVV